MNQNFKKEGLNFDKTLSQHRINVIVFVATPTGILSVILDQDELIR